MSDQDLFALTGDWNAAAALRDQQNIALNEYNWAQERAAKPTSGLLGGNILAGASWNSLNPTLAGELTSTTGQATSNYAVGGATTADTLAQLNTYLDGGGKFDPTATVFLQTGGVDFLQGVDKATIKDNINQICKTLGDQGVNVVLTGSPYAASINDVVTNNFDPKVDPLFNEIAKENKNVALVGVQGEILQNKKLLVDALHTNAEGTSIYNQAVINSLSQFENEVPASTPQAIAQVQRTNTVATTPPVITQAAASPVVAQSLATQIQTPEVDYYAQQFAPDVYEAPVTQSLATQNVDSLIRAGNLNPSQISAATGVPVGEIITQAAALAPFQGSTKVGDTYVSPNYEYNQQGEETIIGGLQSIGTSKVSSEVGSRTELYSPTGELINVGKYEKGPSFFGGLAQAFNDPFVQAAFLGLGGGGFLGSQLGLTGAAGQAVGTGLFKGGTAAAGGASLEDALKVGLLSGGLVYGGNELANAIKYQNVPIDFANMTQDQINDALDVNFRNDLARAGLTDAQIKSFTANPASIYDATQAVTEATTQPVAVSTPVTDGGAVTVTAPTTPSLNNVLNTIASTTPALTVTAPRGTQNVDQATLDLVNSQIAANVTTPNNLANVTVTGQKPATAQEIVNAITSTLPSVTATQAQTVAEQVITSGKPVSVTDVISAITSTLPAVTTPVITPTTTIPTTTITAPKPITTTELITAITAAVPAIVPTTVPTTTITAARPTVTPETINTIASTLTPAAVTPTTTPTTTTPTTTTDPLKVAQLALAAAGLLGAGSKLSTTTPTTFPVVPVPPEWTSPTKGVAPYTPLPAINFGDRNLLRGTQWEKFLSPNYGKVPAPVQYSQPSNLSYNDLMGILGSQQGMPSRSNLSINDVISGIQNQYGQTPTRTMG